VIARVARTTKPNDIKGLGIVLVVGVKIFGSSTVLAWAFLKSALLYGPLNDLINVALRVIPRIAFFGPASPLRSLLAEPGMKADVLIAADVRAEASLAPCNLGRALIELRRALFADPFHTLTIERQ
jgi:hypothetical protein